jgi:hypothetical protein
VTLLGGPNVGCDNDKKDALPVESIVQTPPGAPRYAEPSMISKSPTEGMNVSPRGGNAEATCQLAKQTSTTTDDVLVIRNRFMTAREFGLFWLIALPIYR